jgi:hypothetical protein
MAGGAVTFTAEGLRAVEQLESVLGVGLATSGRVPLGLWSFADCELWISEHIRLFVEIERAQKHPTTNVVKYWPWLDEEPARRLLLIHLFDQNTSRRQLTRWLGERLELTLPRRFIYVAADLPLTERGLGEVTAGFRSLTRV